ncbi:unnamed protein product [Durusdinium trenchii]|uniref:Uncharacterized protein n=1 Tax=Durusdinium trenchii TaxID=1381693 RepID=A0ABP0HRB2_9DINO
MRPDNLLRSHGKEKLGDKPDFAKGSFYFNPLSDTPGTEDDMAKFPWALPKNRWPKEIPELERKCKDLGKVMQEIFTPLRGRSRPHGGSKSTLCSPSREEAEVIGFLGEQVDHVMASKVKTYTANLGKTLRETNKCKGRLLYYFPPKETVAPGGNDVSEEHSLGAQRLRFHDRVDAGPLCRIAARLRDRES